VHRQPFLKLVSQRSARVISSTLSRSYSIRPTLGSCAVLLPFQAGAALTTGLDPHLIIDRRSNPLLATQVAFRRLNGNMPQKELDLFQLVRVKSLPSSIDGEITKILPEPYGNDTVIIQISIRRRASDLELIPTSPTAEVSATEARRAAAFKAWEANPSDPNGVEALRTALRELGWLPS
jgi:hypothetical protein